MLGTPVEQLLGIQVEPENRSYSCPFRVPIPNPTKRHEQKPNQDDAPPNALLGYVARWLQCEQILALWW